MSKAEVQNLQTSLDDTTSSKLPRDQESGLVNDNETNINRNNPQQQTFVSNKVNNSHYSNTIETGRQGQLRIPNQDRRPRKTTGGLFYRLVGMLPQSDPS